MNNKDWTGNSRSLFTTNGDSSHSDKEREANDFYATDPSATEQLCGLTPLSEDIWEPACGKGHISKVLEKHGHRVRSTDLIDRGFGQGGVDFLAQREPWGGDIIVTNPPYKLAMEFARHALGLLREGNRLCMFLKLTFLEGQKRQSLFRSDPPKYVYVARSRLDCPLNGEFKPGASSAVCYAWFICEKGWKGDPMVRWFN
ncbi:MAG: NAD(P)-dependent oxidoreductase [Clostridia bacterium]|nr:NAD(P)-dependent oxidoreductase [Clostridia bacterium]